MIKQSDKLSINYGIFICLCLFVAALAWLQVGKKFAYMFQELYLQHLKLNMFFQCFMNKFSQFLSFKRSFPLIGRGYIMSCNLSELQDQVRILQPWLSMLLWEHLKTFKTDSHVRISHHKALIKESIQVVCEQIIASNSHASKAHVGHSQNFQFCLWSSVHSF